MNKKIRSEVDYVVRQITKNYHPERIILFGSAARGRMHEDSDIDLLIIKRTRKRMVERIGDVLNACTYAIPVEPVVYTPREIEKRLKMGDFFITEIMATGITLYEG